MVDPTGWTFEQRYNYLKNCSEKEWESICKGCGICCLYKYETIFGKIRYSAIVCNELNLDTRQCACYNTRLGQNDCCKIDLDQVMIRKLMPSSCGYVEFLHGRAPYPAKFDLKTAKFVRNFEPLGFYALKRNKIHGSLNWNRINKR